jgi:PAS domain S-box-containing protein
MEQEKAFTQALIDSMPGLFCLVDSNGRLQRWNRNLEIVSGYSADEIAGMTMFDFFGAADAPFIQASFERAHRSGEVTLEANIRAKDGATMPYLLLGRILQFRGEQCFVGIGTDISARKRAEEEARRAESLVRLLLDSTAEGIYGLDLDGRCTMANHASVRLLGYANADSLLGRNMHELIHHTRAGGQPYPAEECLASQAARRGESAHGDNEILWRADGTSFSAEYWSYPMRVDGATVGSVVTFFDITARKAVEAELRLQVTALNAAANAIAITDRRGTIVWINQAFTTLTGYPIHEAVGRNPRDLIKSGIHDQAFYKALWKTISSGRVWAGELTNRRKDGTLYPEHMVITPVADATGKVTHFIAIKRDLTDDKRVEAQLAQSQKMDVVGRLAGGIAHDFNNLLTIINGTAEIAAMDLQEADPLWADLQQIREAGARAAALTRQLLAFSRKQVMKLELLNLNTLIDHFQPMLRRVIGDLATLVVVPNAAIGLVKADAAQIEQVILNLLLNARDAMPSGGVVTIALDNVTLEEEMAGVPARRVVRLSVTDTGVGMDDVTMNRMFEPFFTTKGQDKAAGLGLATVHGIIKQTGGAIAVSSAPGAGTTFTIDLPRVDPAVERARKTPAVAAASEAVLVVEDEAGVRRMIARVLQAAGYRVLDAANGVEAMAVLAREDVDVHVMLSDVVMPQMDGPELARKALELRPRLKVVFMSGHTDDAVLRQDIRDDRTEFIAKPFTKADLTRKIRTVLDDQAPPA